MAVMRYLRDVFLAISVLLVASGLIAGWVLFCVCAWLGATVASIVMGYRPLWRTRK